MSEQQKNSREDLALRGEDTPQVPTGKRRPRLNEASVSPAAQRPEEGEAERNPYWPAQYGGDGLDEVPVQMRP